MSAATAVSSQKPQSGERRGVMLVISSPSGAGKSALTRKLLAQDADLVLSVSVTTRPRRDGEIDGVHYRFIDVPTFDAMRERGDLLEWAQNHDNFYGTPRMPVEEALAVGQDVLFDIDVQGTLQLYDVMRPDVVSVFILPPSIAELERRLNGRASDSPAVVRRRLTTARSEFRRWRDYDYVLVNDDIDVCFGELHGILQTERRKRVRNQALEGRISALQSDLEVLLSRPE